MQFSLIEGIRNSCCEWEEQVTDDHKKVRASFIFQEDFDGFKGHFPDMPILPGIAQLSMIRVIAEKSVDQQLQPKAYTHTKFKSVVNPGEQVFVSMELWKEDGCQGTFTIEKEAGEFVSSGRFEYEYVEGDET